MTYKDYTSRQDLQFLQVSIYKKRSPERTQKQTIEFISIDNVYLEKCLVVKVSERCNFKPWRLCYPISFKEHDCVSGIETLFIKRSFGMNKTSNIQ